MDFKIDEIMNTYAQIIEAAQPTQDIEWNAKIDLPDANHNELWDIKPVFEEQLISTAAKTQGEDIKTLKEKMNPFDKIEDLVERAHPTPVYVSPAMGDGGLVENLNEQHQKLMEIINRHPTGVNIHRAASFIPQLVSLAQELDEAGLENASALVDKTASFFVDSLKKKSNLDKSAFVFAFWMVPAGLALLGGGGTGAWYGFKGRQQNLNTDIKDLISNIESWKDDFPGPATPKINEAYQAAKKMQETAAAWILASSALATDKSESSHAELQRTGQAFNEAFEAFKADVSVVKSLFPGSFFPVFNNYVNNVEADIAALEAMAGQVDSSVRMKQEHAQITNDDLADLEGLDDTSPQSGEVPAAADVKPTLGKNDVIRVQMFLNENFQPIGPATGHLDENWYQALKAFANATRSKLSNAPEMDVSKLVRINPNGEYELIAGVDKLQKVLDLVDEVEAYRRSQIKMSPDLLPAQSQ